MICQGSYSEDNLPGDLFPETLGGKGPTDPASAASALLAVGSKSQIGMAAATTMGPFPWQPLSLRG